MPPQILAIQETPEYRAIQGQLLGCRRLWEEQDRSADGPARIAAAIDRAIAAIE